MMKENFWKKAMAVGLISWIALSLFMAFRKLSKLNLLKEQYKTHIIQTDKKISFSGKEFSSDSILVAFGAFELNLKEALPAANPMNLDIYAMYCGVRIIVPKNWNVKAKGKSFLGGFSNANVKNNHQGNPTLSINYNISYAGLEIVNS